MNPKRIQRKRTKGWRMPDGAVYVGRPTKWGNPWRVGGEYEDLDPFRGEMIAVPITTRAKAVHAFRINTPEGCTFVADVRRELRGKDLACWCPLSEPCHADVLLEIAAKSEPQEDPQARDPR